MKYILSTIIFSCFLSFHAGAQVDYYGGEEGKKLDYVLYYLTQHYVDSTDNEYLTDVAIRSIMSELDPYSVYQTAEELEEMQKADEGYSPEAFGFAYYTLGETSFVTYLNKGGPAELAGMKKSDRIVRVNGVDVTGLNYTKIASFIEDQKNEDLIFSLVNTHGVERNLTIKKALIPLRSVEAGFLQNKFTGYIKIGRFTVNTVKEFKEAVDPMVAYGMSNLVIDLRGNYGGVIDSAVELADLFLLGDKVISYTQGFNLERKDYLSTQVQPYKGINLCVLIDENTMSSAELFTSALQDYDRALVIGRESYGKGLIQQAYSLDDGSAVRMTIGKYFTPTGRYLQRSKEDGKIIETFLQEDEIVFSKDQNVPDYMRFKTANGRDVVASSGGIIPDIYVNDLIPFSQSYTDLNNEGILYAFANSYLLTSGNELRNSYIDPVTFKEDTVFDKQLESLLGNYVVSEIQRRSLSNNLIPRVIEKDIVVQVKSWIAGHLFEEDAYYFVNMKNDMVFNKAIESFTNGTFRKVGIFGY